MTGHNGDEGSIFVPPSTDVNDDASYQDYLKSLITPLVFNASALNHITQVLYPPIFDGSQGYTTQAERTNLTIADLVFVCNTRALTQADFDVPTYGYVFSAQPPPPLHGVDLNSTFYDFGEPEGVNTTVAKALQAYIVRFAQTGSPNGPGLPDFPPVNAGTKVQNLGRDFIGPVEDEGGVKQLEDRCRYWQDAPYLMESDLMTPL